MNDPERIYLQPDYYPAPDAASHEGRTWAETDISGQDTEYVRADLYDEVKHERDAAMGRSHAIIIGREGDFRLDRHEICVLMVVAALLTTVLLVAVRAMW